MRTFKLPFTLCLALELITPKPAHAWFEFLDYLSGPGPFKAGAPITLQIFEPRLSFPLSGQYDFLEAQTGLGIYRFSSEGFTTFSGFIFEPIRLELHLPSRLADRSVWGRISARVELQRGVRAVSRRR